MKELDAVTLFRLSVLGPLISRASLPRGEQQGSAKLTDAIVREIREKYVPFVVTCRDLGRRFGVNLSTVHRVVARKYWRHVA